jgi:predicted DNA-binding transcriptional regulator AlpA
MGKGNSHSSRGSIRAEIDNYADNVLLTEPETAEASGLSPLTLKRWRLTGSKKGPSSIKVYRMVRYRVAEVRRWLAQLSAAV